MRLALTAAACVTPQRYLDNAVVLIEDGVIAAVSTREDADLPRGARLIDLPGAILAPGFVDLHIHGGAGHDVMHADAAELAAIERHLAAHGTTTYFPTTATAPVEDTLQALDRLADAVERADRQPPTEVRAQPLGIHLEGPFISYAKRGVHPPESLQPPSLELFERFWQAARGHIKLMTIAPELPGACELIAAAAQRGVCVSLGHSDAGYTAAQAGIAAGARHATHTFNAMRALDHREPGIAGAVLNEAGISADIIADGIHVAPAMVALFLKAKGTSRAVLITDAISATGMPEGRYALGSLEVDVSGGKCLSAEGRLAGSVLTLERAVRNVMDFAGWDLQDAVRLATMNPAHTVGLGLRRGTLVSGARGDVVALSPEGNVVHTIVCGQSP
ncbi:MAG: N-acetylglucosamine-6-phosphate deacetylase [Terriglobales bacterium]